MVIVPFPHSHPTKGTGTADKWPAKLFALCPFVLGLWDHSTNAGVPLTAWVVLLQTAFLTLESAEGAGALLEQFRQCP